MAIPQCKEELIVAIHNNHAKLDKALSQIPLDLVYEKTLDGHRKNTTMSVANLVSYLVGWNELVLKWLSRFDAGQEIDFPETGYKWNELGKLAEKFYIDYEDLLYSLLLEELGKIKEQIVNSVQGRTDEELYGCPWYEKWTMGRMIQLNTSSPYNNARLRVQKWRKENMPALK